MLKFFLLDCNYLASRSYFALPKLINQVDNVETGGLYGFMNSINHIVMNFNFDYIVGTFDYKGKKFRHDLYNEYKKNRSSMPKEYYDQIELCKLACKNFNIPILEIENYEADDLISFLSLEAKKLNILSTIVSCDKVF